MSIEFGRKPYISKSYAGMMKRVPNKAVWNQRLVKQSEFEKPYKKDENYSEMQHYFPTNHLPGADYPDMPIGGRPGGGTSTGLQWWGCEGSIFEKYSDGDCLSVGGTATVEFKENTPGIEGFGGDPIVGYVADHPLRLVSVARNQATGLTAYLSVTVALDESTTADSLTITATTESGETCTASVDICPCNCTGISIGYTTQGMQVSEQQTLSVVGAVEGCVYTWEITSGGGSLSASTGVSVIYTAPATNPNCVSNPTITLGVEGLVCDSLKIAVNGIAQECDIAAGDRCLTTYSEPRFCTRYINCSGIYHRVDGNPADCGGGTDGFCDGRYGCTGYLVYRIVFGGTYGEPPGIKDARTQELKDAGCCPPQLL